jgi:hypothetical protein
MRPPALMRVISGQEKSTGAQGETKRMLATKEGLSRRT